MTPEQAEELYRDAWVRRKKLARGVYEAAWLEGRMDTLQPIIARNPDDPRWIKFKATLP